MPVQVKVAGTGQFQKLAKDLKQVADGRIARSMGKAMKRAAEPAMDDMRSTVRGITTLGGGGGRGGASARAARQAHFLRKRKVTAKALAKARAASGLRAAAANTVQASVRTSGRSAGVYIRSRASLMPPDQRKLPMYMNRGQWRHPVFASGNWVTQAVTPGWFDRPARKHGPRVREEAFRAVIQTINQIAS
jgi:hypothetical protein